MPIPAAAASVSGASATLADLISETKRHLHSLQREPKNKLANALTATGTVLTFTYDIGSLQAQSYVEIDLELMYVWSVDAAVKSAIVERAQLGSVAATHLTASIVTVNPKFPDFTILKALNDDLADLSSPGSGLFAVRTVDVTSSGSRVGYDLTGTTGLIDIIEVRYDSRSDRNWPLLHSWSLARSVDATAFASGLTLNFYDGPPSGRTINVLYKAAFTALSGLGDVVTTVTGLPTSAIDLPPLGAAMRLVAPREIKRNTTEAQGEPRRAQEVPPGAVSASARGIMQLRERRIQSEANRLAAQYPTRMR